MGTVCGKDVVHEHSSLLWQCGCRLLMPRISHVMNQSPYRDLTVVSYSFKASRVSIKGMVIFQHSSACHHLSARLQASHHGLSG